MPTAGVASNQQDSQEDEEALQALYQRAQTGALPAGRSSSASPSTLASVKPVGLETSDSLTPAQQRELERESAFRASTGSTGGGLADATTAAGASSGKSKASQPSWGAIAGKTNGNAASGGTTSTSTGTTTGQGTDREPPGATASRDSTTGSATGSTGAGSSHSIVSKHQSLGDGESEADMNDYDPRGFATGSTDTASSYPVDTSIGGGQVQVGDPRNFGASSGLQSRARPSMGGDEAYEDEEDSRNFMVNRDPTRPSSAVGAQQRWNSQLQSGQQLSAGASTAATGGQHLAVRLCS